MPSDERIDLRVTPEEKARFAAAAKADGLLLSSWLRRLATREAARILGKAPAKRK